MRSHPDAPRVLIANSNLVPQWAIKDYFHELDKELMMYGQMTAGSWIYIGTRESFKEPTKPFAQQAEHTTAMLISVVDLF